MSYRDESESLRARVDQLEGELVTAGDRIARLEGASPSPEVVRELQESRMLGAPSGITLERTLPFEIDESGYEAIAEVVRTRLKLQVSQVGHALTTLGDPFSLRREDGKTRVRLRGDWRLLKGGIVALPALAFLFGGLPVVGVVAELSTHGAPLVALNLLWAVPAMLGGAAYLARRRTKSQAEEQLRTHQGVFEAVMALAERHAVREPVVPVRVRASDAESSEVAADRASAQPPARRFT